MDLWEAGEVKIVWAVTSACCNVISTLLVTTGTDWLRTSVLIWACVCIKSGGKLLLFFSPALDGVEWSVSLCVPCIPQKLPVPLLLTEYVHIKRQAAGCRSGVLHPVEARCTLPVQTGPGAHPAPYTMGNGSLSWG